MDPNKFIDLQIETNEEVTRILTDLVNWQRAAAPILEKLGLKHEPDSLN